MRMKYWPKPLTIKRQLYLRGRCRLHSRNLRPISQIHYTITPPGRFADIVACWKSIEFLKDRVANSSLLLPCHEPAIEARITQTPVFGL